MARYIDAEKIVFWIRHVSKDGLEDDVRKIAFSDEIARMPTADVAPRAEVEKLHEVIFKKEDLMQKIAEERNKYADELEVAKDTNEHLKAEVAREIFEEIEKLHLHITNDFDARRYEDLKKKYTEGQK